MFNQGFLLLVEGVDFLFEGTHVGPPLFGFVLFSGFEQLTNFPAGGVLLGLEVVDLFLGVAPFLIQREDAVEHGGSVNAALGQGLGEGVAVVAENLKGQHGL